MSTQVRCLFRDGVCVGKVSAYLELNILDDVLPFLALVVAFQVLSFPCHLMENWCHWQSDEKIIHQPIPAVVCKLTKYLEPIT